MRIFRSLSGVKSFAVNSIKVGEIVLMGSAQKLIRRSGFCLSTVNLKSLDRTGPIGAGFQNVADPSLLKFCFIGLSPASEPV